MWGHDDKGVFISRTCFPDARCVLQDLSTVIYMYMLVYMPLTAASLNQTHNFGSAIPRTNLTKRYSDFPSSGSLIFSNWFQANCSEQIRF